MKIIIKGSKRRIRIVPTLGPVCEQSQPLELPPAAVAGWLFPFSKKQLRRNLLMAFTMSDTQETTITAGFVDKKGNPAKVDGKPQWLTDNSALLALTPSDDGLSCLVQAVGPLGTAMVTMKADADMGAGVTEVIGAIEVEITSGQAATVVLTPGTPSEQP